MKLHHVAITIKDLTVSIPFYEEYFGFKEKVRFRRDDMGGTGVMLEGENIIIELWQFDVLNEGAKEELSFTGIRHIAFTHNDPEALRNSFIEKGINCGQFRVGASGGQYFFLSDPDGNQIEVYKPAMN
ncbi:MAG: VOC family protein [Candidatus Pacebacteria bacterium]|nr:VOC family protein [Candidatus Paceibacterota bacterium]